MTVFSECLKNIRDSHLLNTTQIANLMEYDVSTVHRWCNGTRTPSSFEPIKNMSAALQLSDSEQTRLEDTYLETIYGQEKFQHYQSVKKLLHYLNKECRKICHFKSMPTSPSDEKAEKEPFFKSIESHFDFLQEVTSLIQNTAPDETIYLKLCVLNMEIYHIITCLQSLSYSHKLRIIFCMSDRDLFTSDNSYEFMRGICELFLYNKDCLIYLTTKKSLTIESHKNCIFSKKQALHFDDTLQSGISTNYSEWIDHVLTDYQYLEKNSRIIINKKITVVEPDLPFTKNDTSIAYEFMPCVSLCFDRKLLDSHFYPDLPNRRELIDAILKSYAMEERHLIKSEIICCEEGIRTFMETGKLTIFPYPVYTPFSMEERRVILQKYIDYMKSDNYSCQCILHKNMELENVPCLEFQINEYGKVPNASNVNLTFILEDFSTQCIFFYSPAMIECFKDYLEVIRNPWYSYSPEETIAKMEEILVNWDRSNDVNGDRSN